MEDVVSDVVQSKSDGWHNDNNSKKETLKVNHTDVDIIMSTYSAHLQGSSSSSTVHCSLQPCQPGSTFGISNSIQDHCGVFWKLKEPQICLECEFKFQILLVETKMLRDFHKQPRDPVWRVQEHSEEQILSVQQETKDIPYIIIKYYCYYYVHLRSM